MLKAINVLIISDEKTVSLQITDPVACHAALGDTADGKLFADLTDFAEDVLAGNPDAGLVELNPENVVKVMQGYTVEPAAAPVPAAVAPAVPASEPADAADEPVLEETKP